jgi:hypothetical protein
MPEDTEQPADLVRQVDKLPLDCLAAAEDLTVCFPPGLSAEFRK